MNATLLALLDLQFPGWAKELSASGFSETALMIDYFIINYYKRLSCKLEWYPIYYFVTSKKSATTRAPRM